jgi:hypothetical protein
LVEASSASGQVPVAESGRVQAPQLDAPPAGALEVPVDPDANVDPDEIKYYLPGYTYLGVFGNLTMYAVVEPIAGGTIHGNYTVNETFDRFEMLPPSSSTTRMPHLLFLYDSLDIGVDVLYRFFKDKLRSYRTVVSVIRAVPRGTLVYIHKMDFKALPSFSFTDEATTVHEPTLYRFKKVGPASDNTKLALISLHNCTNEMIKDFVLVNAAQGETYTFQQAMNSLQMLSSSKLQHLKGTIEFKKASKRSEFENGLCVNDTFHMRNPLI